MPVLLTVVFAMILSGVAMVLWPQASATVVVGCVGAVATVFAATNSARLAATNAQLSREQIAASQMRQAREGLMQRQVGAVGHLGSGSQEVRVAAVGELVWLILDWDQLVITESTHLLDGDPRLEQLNAERLRHCLELAELAFHKLGHEAPTVEEDPDYSTAEGLEQKPGDPLSWARGRGLARLGEQLTRTALRALDLVRVDMTGAEIWNTNLDNVMLASAHLERVDFQHVSLRGAYFAYADLRGANFSNTVLDGAVVQKAHLEKACFWDADLREVVGLDTAFLKLSVYGAGAQFPEGFDPHDAGMIDLTQISADMDGGDGSGQGENN